MHFNGDCHSMSLSVKCVNLLTRFVIKASLWKIFIWAIRNIKFVLKYLANIFCISIIEEMIMRQTLVMEQTYENDFIRNKATTNHWVRKVINSFSWFINLKHLIECYFIFINSAEVHVKFIFFSECSDFEQTVVKESDSKFGCVWILLNVFHFDVIASKIFDVNNFFIF